MDKIIFTVFDKDGNDVTDEKGWYIDSYGNLFFITDDVDMPLHDADDYTYSVVGIVQQKNN